MPTLTSLLVIALDWPPSSERVRPWTREGIPPSSTRHQLSQRSRRKVSLILHSLCSCPLPNLLSLHAFPPPHPQVLGRSPTSYWQQLLWTLRNSESSGQQPVTSSVWQCVFSGTAVPRWLCMCFRHSAVWPALPSPSQCGWEVRSSGEDRMCCAGTALSKRCEEDFYLLPPLHPSPS